MRSVEITRAGNLSVADHLAEIRGWFDRAGIQATDLQVVRVLSGQVTFSATFERADDADRFLRAFNDPRRLPYPP
jgi:hypothetical protein